MIPPRLVLALALCALSLPAQPARFTRSLPDISPVWLQARFADADKLLRSQLTAPMEPFERSSLMLQRAEFETARGNYGVAAASLHQVEEEFLPTGLASLPLFWRARAELAFATGQYADARAQLLMTQKKWDGVNVAKLQLATPRRYAMLGDVELAYGRTEVARALFERTVKETRHARHGLTESRIRANAALAVILATEGANDRALQLIDETLKEALQIWGSPSIPLADTLHAAADVAIQARRMEDAESFVQRAIAMRERIYGPYHLKLAESYVQAALLASAQVDHKAAVEWVSRAMDIERRAGLPGVNGHLARTLATVAPVLVAAGDAKGARECYANALPVLERELGADVPAVVAVRKRALELNTPAVRP